MTAGYGNGPDILHDCTVSVEPGEIAVIVGPNGAGKSTAMKAIFTRLYRNRAVMKDIRAVTVPSSHSLPY
jgi:branched-chain amino acid transport system ATP-binding protein